MKLGGSLAKSPANRYARSNLGRLSGIERRRVIGCTGRGGAVAGSPFRGGALAGVRQNGDLGFDSARIWVKEHRRV